MLTLVEIATNDDALEPFDDGDNTVRRSLLGGRGPIKNTNKRWMSLIQTNAGVILMADYNDHVN